MWNEKVIARWPACNKCLENGNYYCLQCFTFSKPDWLQGDRYLLLSVSMNCFLGGVSELEGRDVMQPPGAFFLKPEERVPPCSNWIQTRADNSLLEQGGHNPADRLVVLRKTEHNSVPEFTVDHFDNPWGWFDCLVVLNLFLDKRSRLAQFGWDIPPHPSAPIWLA